MFTIPLLCFSMKNVDGNNAILNETTQSCYDMLEIKKRISIRHSTLSVISRIYNHYHSNHIYKHGTADTQPLRTGTS